MSTKYLEQYERMLRWYKRFEEINDDKVHDQPSDFYEDEVLAFFQNCYHLKDWLINSGVIAKDKVETFINLSPEMSICADLCNGSKHLRLIGPRTGDNSTGIAARHYKLSLPEERIAVKYEVVSSNQKYDAFSLATTCIKEWDDFLTQEGFLE